jgi:hypothetical protein
MTPIFHGSPDIFYLILIWIYHLSYLWIPKAVKDLPLSFVGVTGC